MASSSAFSDSHPPVRSISLPPRVHPTSVKLESALNHLKTLQNPSPVLEAVAIQNGLVGLAEFYNCIEEFIHSAQTQKALLRHGKLVVEEALEGTVTLLDTCGTARDMFLTMKDMCSPFNRLCGEEEDLIQLPSKAKLLFKETIIFKDLEGSWQRHVSVVETLKQVLRMAASASYHL